MCTVRHESGAVASHYHGFDQPAPMDRTDHRLVCEQGDVRVEGWIPLTVRVDAVMDDSAVEKLTECGRDFTAELEVEALDEEFLAHRSRGKARPLTKKIRWSCTPNTDKQAVYTQSVQRLLADQIVFLRDGGHTRVVTEENGQASVAMAEVAVTLAGG